MDPMSAESIAAFERDFERLFAIVHERVEIQWRFHRRADLEQLGPDLTGLLREFGALLRVVYRYDLTDALASEAAWYASALASRGPGEDALALLLDSWIVAIEGTIKPPECNALAAPLQTLRADLPHVFSAAERRRGAAPAAEIGTVVESLIAGDFAEAWDALRGRMSGGTPPHELIVELLLPAMAEVGRRWELNELAIFQEHLATETVQRLIGGLSGCGAAVEPLHRTALVACVPQEEHQTLPAALSAYLALRGWKVRSLGRSMPAEQVVRAAEALKPDAVFLSLSMLSRLHETLELVARLAAPMANGPLLVGGRGAAPARRLLEAAGAQVTQDFDEAHRWAQGGAASHA
ncbi:MAG: hypothetical protein GX575_12790 [Candidatus Anammoximicrobium sp.]|nr:hypothetical protein [Candidatus Anammoximicrobium sp.]